MTTLPTLDGLLVQWGDRLFYPGNRIVRSPPAVRGGVALADRARAIRARLHATVVRGAPQVMVKVTGGGRGMAAIAAHFRYISKQGRLSIEDDRGVEHEGKEGVHDLVEQWRHAGARIAERSPRREACNIMLSMPAGTPESALKVRTRGANLLRRRLRRSPSAGYCRLQRTSLLRRPIPYARTRHIGDFARVPARHRLERSRSDPFY